MTARDDGDEYRRALADLYRDALEDARSVALKPGATAADVARALEMEIGKEPTSADGEPTSPGRPSPLRAAQETVR